MTEKLSTVLCRANASAAAVEQPAFIREVYSSNSSAKSLDEAASPSSIHAAVSAMTKPVFSVLGGFNAGKTFIIKHMTNFDQAKVGVAPTTCTLTVYRHAADKPADWGEPGDMVFALKRTAPPLSLSKDDIGEAAGYSELERLTTYDGKATASRVVVVFLDAEFLADKVLIDCPGVGNLQEAAGEASAQNVYDELESQNVAMDSSDGFLVLSAAVGQTGMFADNNTANVLYKMANHVQRFPTAEPHDNTLLVVSQADPSRDGLSDESILVETARTQVLKQCANLPPLQKPKIDAAALSGRIVPFYKLDATQKQKTISEWAKVMRRHSPNLSEAECLQMAREQYESDRDANERVRGFDAAFRKMFTGMQSRMDAARVATAQRRIECSLSHYSGQQQRLAMQVASVQNIKEQAKKYQDETADREAAWTQIGNCLSEDRKRYQDEAQRAFEAEYSRLSDPVQMERFIRQNFNDDQKDKAKLYLPDLVTRNFSAQLGKGMHDGVDGVWKETRDRLQVFDEKFLAGQSDKVDQAQMASELGANIELNDLQTFSAVDAFSRLTIGIGGVTLVAAGFGSAFAVAVIAKALALGFGLAGMVGLSGAAAGAILGLAAVPFWGWLALGGVGLWYALRNVFKDWQETLARTAADSLKDRKRTQTVFLKVRETLKKVFGEAEKELSGSLKATKNHIDEHIKRTKRIADGEVSIDDLRSGVRYYGELIGILAEAKEELKSL